MIEKKKTSKYVKPTLVSNSARYKIGGKEYTATDVSRLKPQTKEVHAVTGTENAPRHVSKKLENQSGVVNTSAGTVSPSQNVHAQGEAYKPSSNTQATVQTATLPQNNTYKPSVSKAIVSPPSVQNTGTPGMSTGIDAGKAAEQRVQAQTESYYSTNAVEAVRTPKIVEAIKTGANPSVQTTSAAKPGPQPQPMAATPGVKTPANQPSHTQSSPTQSPAGQGMGSPNIKTATEVNRVVQQSVQTQTQNFHSNNAFSTERTEIRSGVERHPRTVEAVKTAAPLTGKQQPVASPQNIQQGSTGKPGPSTGGAIQGVKTPAGQPSHVPSGSARPSAVPDLGSQNVRTESQVKSAVQNSVQTQTEHFHSNNAFSTERTEIRSGVERHPRTVEAVKTSAPLTGKQQPQGMPQNGQQPSKAVPQTMAAGQGGKSSGAMPSRGRSGPSHEPAMPEVGGANIRTASEINRVVERSVQTQTEHFHSNNAFSTERTEIRSGVERHPRAVEAVKTAAPLTGKQQAGAKGGNQQNDAFGSKGLNNTVVARIKQVPNNAKSLASNMGGIPSGVRVTAGGAVAYRPNIPSIGAGNIGTFTLSRQQVADLKASIRRMGMSDNVVTGNVLHSENLVRTFNLSAGAREGKIFSNIRTGQRRLTQAVAGREGTGEFLRSLGATAKYTIGNEAASALQKWKTSPKKNELISGGKLLLGKAEGELLSEDDLGTQAAGGVIAAGMLGAAGFKGAQLASDVGIQGIKKIGDGAYQVTTTAGRASITVGMTAKTIIEKQMAPFSKETLDVLRTQAQLSGLNNTKIVKGIVSKVDRVRTTYQNAAANVRRVKSAVTAGAGRVKTAVDTSVKIVHGVATGTMSVNLAKLQVEAFRQRMFKGIQTGVARGVKTAAGYAVRGASKGVGVTLFRGIPKTTRLAKTGIMTAAGVMMSSDDYAVQGVGNALTAVDIGLKTSVMATKATGYTIKTAVNSGKSVYAGAKFIKDRGLNAAWERARIQARRKVVEIGKSIVTMIIESAKALVSKYAVPIILIIVMLMVMFGGLASLMTATGTIFGGVFNEVDDDKEYSFMEYLLDPSRGLPPLTQQFKQELIGKIESSKGSYHIVRFYSDMNQNDVMDASAAGVSAGMPSDQMLAGILQPIYNAIILVEYDLDPTRSQAVRLIKEMFEELFTIEEAATIEECGQAIRDGEGEVVTCGECNRVHALTDCPNPIIGRHSTFTCSKCDSYYYLCDGHVSRTCTRAEHTHTSYCYYTMCGLNHNHNSDCYYTNCGYGEDDWWHFHTSSCYYKRCGYSEHRHHSGCYRTDYCNNGSAMSRPCSNSTRYFRCTGYRYCGKHNVYTYVLHLEGLTNLVRKYFTDPINALESNASRTEDEEKRLVELKEAYEIMQVLIEEADEVDFDFGGAGAGGMGGGAGAGGEIGGGSASVFYGGGGLMTPVRFTALTSPFGWRIHPVSGEEKFHSGVDLAAPQGTPIYAAADGEVTQAYYDSAYGGGNTVIIVHNNGYQTGYCHMVRFIVSAGQKVKQGQCIGYVGNTGVSTGPHLHLTVRLNGERVNPVQHIDLNWKPGDDGGPEIES